MTSATKNLTAADVGVELRALNERRAEVVAEKIALTARREQIAERTGAAVIDADALGPAIASTAAELAGIDAQLTVADAAVVEIDRRIEDAKARLAAAQRHEGFERMRALDEELEAVFDRLLPPFAELVEHAKRQRDLYEEMLELVRLCGATSRYANVMVPTERIEHLYSQLARDVGEAKAKPVVRAPAQGVVEVMARRVEVAKDRVASVLKRVAPPSRDESDWTAEA